MPGKVSKMLGNRFMRLLRTNEMNVRIQSASGEDQTFTSDDFCCDADNHSLRNPGHHVGITRLADTGNHSVLDADVGFVNTAPIYDERVSDNAVERIRITNTGSLSHAFSDNLATAKLTFVPINGEIFFNFKDERRIAKPNLVAGGRTEHGGILAAIQFAHKFILLKIP